MATPRPNILFMHSHNTGRFVQPMGYAVPTPNLQRLAEGGVLFRQAFSTAPTCSPSRSSFLTGMYPHSCGMLGLAHRGFAMDDYGYHVVRTLRQAGYFTALAGVEHTAPDVTAVGYERLLSTLDTNYPDLPQNNDPVSAVVDFLGENHDRPFFVSFGLNETHRPFPPADPSASPAEDERYCMPPPLYPDAPELRADMADFKAAARVMDTAYGAVLEALDRNGLADNTLVFCFSDHGLQFARHMSNLTDAGIGVYLVIRGPDGFTGGTVVDEQVSLLDLVPTVYDVAGVDTPSFVQGSSLRPLLSDDPKPLHEEIFAESNYHAAYEPIRCVRNRRYKYIRRFDDRERPVLPNLDDTVTKEFFLKHGLRDRHPPEEALYDLVFDPWEQNNLVSEPAFSAELEALRSQLNSWMNATNDPLLAGTPVRPRTCAFANDPDGVSPNGPVLPVKPLPY
jgi:N-sulfoglucosamine sulfohydrolase